MGTHTTFYPTKFSILAAKCAAMPDKVIINSIMFHMLQPTPANKILHRQKKVLLFHWQFRLSKSLISNQLAISKSHSLVKMFVLIFL